MGNDVDPYQSPRDAEAELLTPTGHSLSDRPIDLLSATTLVAASMIGAGVFTTSGFSLGDLRSPWLVMAAWAVAGLIAISGALCYGALATKFAESGGEYLFLSRALHPIAGMMAGWVSLLAGFTGAIAFAATAFAKYLQPLLPESNPLPASVMASGMVVVAAILHTIGVKPGARVARRRRDFEVRVDRGLRRRRRVCVDEAGLTRSQAILNRQAIDPPPPWIGFRFATQLMWISLSYSGFNAAVYIAGEVKGSQTQCATRNHQGHAVGDVGLLDAQCDLCVRAASGNDHVSGASGHARGL